MDKEPNRTDMVGPFLGKGKGLACQSSQPLAQGIIKAFNVAGETTAFLNNPMPGAGKSVLIRLPFICVQDGALAITRREFRPQGLGTLTAAVADMQRNDFSSLGIQGNPEPDFVVAFADKAPYLIALED